MSRTFDAITLAGFLLCAAAIGLQRGWADAAAMVLTVGVLLGIMAVTK